MSDSDSSPVTHYKCVSPYSRPLHRFNACYSPGNLNKTPIKMMEVLDWSSPSSLNSLVAGDYFCLRFTFADGLADDIGDETLHYNSPPNKCKSAKIIRKKKSQFSRQHSNSFEANQSLPPLKTHRTRIMDTEAFNKQKTIIDLVRVDGSNGVRFNSSLACSPAIPGDVSSLGLNQTQNERLQQGINTQKAVFTVDPKTSKILIVNSKACALLGYSSTELCSMKFSGLLHDKSSSKIPVYGNKENDVSNEDGNTIVVLSGKVVEMLSNRGVVVLVSLWIRQLDTDGPYLVVAEPVHSKQAIFKVDGESGMILSCEGDDSTILFQAESIEKLIGVPVSTLVPSIVLPDIDSTSIPKHISKQKATGRTLDGSTFPLCLWIRPSEDLDPDNKLDLSDNKYKRIFTITIRVFHNVSGLLVVDEAGLVSACNPHFAQLTFGAAQHEVIGRPVTQIIPNFCRDAQLLKRPRRLTLSPVPAHDDNSDTDTDAIDSCGLYNFSQKSACTSYNIQQSQTTQDKSSSALCLDKSSSYVCTHTTTPTQDMVSSISTEQRLPDLISEISNVSINGEDYPSISKSRSENVLGSENRENNINVANRNVEKCSDKSESYYSSKVTLENAGTTQRARYHDPSLRLSLDSSKYRQSLKAALPGTCKDDKSSISLDFCDSNETSADFLTPINETPGAGEIIEELEDLPTHNGNGDYASQTDVDPYLNMNIDSPKRSIELDTYSETPSVVKRIMKADVTTSTPQHIMKVVSARQESWACRVCTLNHCADTCRHKDGTYKGVVLHKDGTELSIIYVVSSMQLSSGSHVQCVWLSVQLLEEVLHMPHVTLASSINSTADNSLAIGNKSVGSRPQSMSIVSQCGEEQISGDYTKHYVTLKQIGKGAYGCVKMAYRRSDRLLVIAKFILKEKVNQQFWVDAQDKNGRKIPLEVSLLLSLKHPNIVNVLDVYENEKYFQMIMEKHGSGMDLFEFIERRPRLDELLTSHIFRQVGLAVEYLHSLSILHRDIKDENIIIDNGFQVKLIDFGSATFMSEGSLFSMFFGTTEYCSPEVLEGNKYAGPELEMWSMGVTLFVLTFFSNPFTDIEDTIQGPLKFPHPRTSELENLLSRMLCKDPLLRCTVPEMMSHSWITQSVNINNYNFAQIIDCESREANPETHYSGSLCSPRSISPNSQGDAERSNLDISLKQESKQLEKADTKRTLDKDAHSDNYSLRSSADILDISSKPISDAADVSSDATGHAACDIDYDQDNDQYDCDSWDECEQDSLS